MVLERISGYYLGVFRYSVREYFKIAFGMISGWCSGDFVIMFERILG